MSRRVLFIILAILNAVVLLGQLWPEGAPPFARGVTIVTITADIVVFIWMIRGGSSMAMVAFALLACGAAGCTSTSQQKDAEPTKRKDEAFEQTPMHEEAFEQTRKMVIGRWVNTTDASEVLEIDDAAIKRYYGAELVDSGNAYEVSHESCDARLDSAGAAGWVFLKESTTQGEPLCFVAIAGADYLELVYTPNGRMHSYRRLE